MRQKTPRPDRLAATLASGALATVVRYFAVNPETRPHIRHLERATGLWPRSLKNELDRLTALGILQRRLDGNRVRYELDESHPAWPDLRGLVRHLSTPAEVLRLAVAEVPGVEAAFIFGSHARGTERADSDVDVFVIGDGVSEEELARRTLEAGVLLGREVDTLYLTRKDLEKRLGTGGRFVREVLAGKKQWLYGDATRLREATSQAARDMRRSGHVGH